MRRLLGLGVLVGLMALSTVALAGVATTQSYKDAFTAGVSYKGSDGSIPWEQPWYEIGDDGSPGSGLVHVYTGGCYDYKCLNIEGHGDVGTLGAKRYADLSFFESAELCFDVVAELAEDESISKGVLSVQVADDNQNWKTINSYSLQNLNWASTHGRHNLDGFLSEAFGVRFIVTGTLEGEVFVDNVEIKGSAPGTSTSTTSSSSTTSTTKPIQITTTSEHKPTTTTTIRDTTTTTMRATETTESVTTTTAVAETTTTVAAAIPLGPADPPTDSGLRTTSGGVQVDYSEQLFGKMDMATPEVLGVELDANYSMAVEVFSATWIWMVALLLIVATAIVTGLDRRRSQGGPVSP